MFIVNEDSSIYVTRGDVAYITVTADKRGNIHKFQPGDVLRFKVFAKKDCDNVVLQKDFPIFAEIEAVEICLDENDTKIGGVISKPTDYWYEVELNPLTDPETIIGYDEDGAKIFKLFPEGKDLEDKPIEPEDIPIIDEALDLASKRPIANHVVARELVKLTDSHKATNKKSDDAAATADAVKVRLDNLIAHDDITDISRDLEYLGFITEATKAKVDGEIISDGVYATIKVNLREANIIYGGTELDMFIIPDECRPINIGTIHTEDGLDYIIKYDTTNKYYYLTIRAQSGVSVAPSGAGSVTMTYALGEYELKDVRVDIDGIVYETAGEAVREQHNRAVSLASSLSLYDLNVVREHLGLKEIYKDISLSGKINDASELWRYVSKTLPLSVGTYTVVIRNTKNSDVGYFAIKSTPTTTTYLKATEPGVYVVKIYDDEQHYNGTDVVFLLQLSTDTGVEPDVYFAAGISVFEGDITQMPAFSPEVLGTEIKIDKRIGKNLFNKDTVKMNLSLDSGGRETVNEYSHLFYVSDFIPVEANTVYALTDYMIGGASIVFFDGHKTRIGNLVGSLNEEHPNLNDLSGIFTTPENCKYIRISGNITNLETNQLEKGDKITEYEEYTEYVPLLDLKKQVEEVEEKVKEKHYVPETVTREILSDGENISIASPNAKNHNTIGFYAKVIEFDKIIVSHGKTNPYCSSYIAIDSSSVYVYEYPSKESLAATYKHGLQIADFIGVNIHVDGGFTAKLTLTSASGSFVKEIAWNGSNGDIMVESVGSALANCTLNYYINGLKKDIWLFGDSYFDFWCKNIVGWGYDNFYLDGYSGRNAEAAFESLQKCLTYCKPKKIAWFMGMNNVDKSEANDNWETTYDMLAEICLQNNIELILSTVPTVPGRTHIYKNDIVRNSGFRYIDIDTAVGAYERSIWYDGLLGGDGVHPSSIGSVVIANYIANHLPEIL